MTDKARPDYDEIHIAANFQDFYDLEREVFALKFITSEGKKIIVELPGQGARLLRDKLVEQIRKTPQIEHWSKNYKPN